MKVMHIGVPTKKIKPNENYIEGLKVFVTNPEEHDYKFEFLRFEENSPMANEIQANPHIAILVENIHNEIFKANKILQSPFDAGDYILAFIERDGVIFELMQPK
ncbi:hypothetical protein [Cetobacterium sp.]